MKQKLTTLVLALALCLSLLPAQAMAAQAEVSVTIFTTNDMHGTLEGDGTVGIVQAAAMKASTPNALLVDAGDATQGASFATISQGEDMIRMMNAAGYDVMAAGNHEFDYGIDQLLANAATADFPILSANVALNGGAMLPGSTVVEVADKSIGFIGLITVNTATSTNPSKLTGVSFEDEREAAKEQIAALADKTDAIVIICHLGNLDSAVDCTSGDLLDALSKDELSAVAAVIDGHSHTVEQENYTRDGVSIPLVQTGTMFTAIGKLELTFDGGSVTATGAVLSAEEAAAYTLTENGQAVAAQVQAALDCIKAEQAEIRFFSYGAEVSCKLAHGCNPLCGVMAGNCGIIDPVKNKLTGKLCLLWMVFYTPAVKFNGVAQIRFPLKATGCTVIQEIREPLSKCA